MGFELNMAGYPNDMIWDDIAWRSGSRMDDYTGNECRNDTQSSNDTDGCCTYASKLA